MIAIGMSHTKSALESTRTIGTMRLWAAPKQHLELQTMISIASVAKPSKNTSHKMQEEITSKLCSRLEEFKGTGEPVNLSDAFGCVATDAVTGYCFHKSYNVLDSPDFAASFQRAFRDFSEIGIWHRHFGYILDVFQMIPRWLVAIMNPAGVFVLDMFNVRS